MGEAPVFCSDYDFRIPTYQRPYAWGVDQADQLLSDLVETLDSGSDEPYFLGSIVLVKDPSQAIAEVIDGQQRLTTLTILFAVLRDLADDPELQAELDAAVAEPGKISKGLAAKPRLTLRSKDAEFFRSNVQTRGAIPALLDLSAAGLKTDAQKALRDNAKSLHKALSEWTAGRRLDLVQMLIMRTFLVVVSTPDLHSAHRIFSVMNSRGLDLSPADIFKSQIIGDLGEGHAADVAAAKWENAEEALGRDDFGDLFLHLRMIYAKERAKAELLKEFPKQVLEHFLPGKAQAFVNEVLVPYADAYAQIRDHDYAAATGAERVNVWFQRLVQIDNNDWRPSALWALRNHAPDPEWLAKFFQALERLAASMFIRRVYTTPRVQRYAELLKELDAGQGLASPSLRLTEEELSATRERINGPLYLDLKTRKYVLLRLDEALAKSSGVVYNHPLITVEHVLPQNPKADSQWLADFTDDERQFWTHRLGNLVLLNRYKNAEAQNHDFAKKKATYFTGKLGVANFALTAKVVSANSWTPTTLAARQSELIGELCSAWEL
ncbi:DUF262 domain-containing protein [Streptomyces sp. H39-C1]|uniref:DUF262 domain-containing protein n=1 Tax=Streptomyces sp. H39-C1 TaxID=3004355 RepID=UPI0022AE7A96|nr:DUF262 domain-containing protein [Streptomyces sp. H39-C1]MCZ4103378.1 DUF262 domain-containing protein [Streptomyces sp. H39-C1]